MSCSDSCCKRRGQHRCLSSSTQTIICLFSLLYFCSVVFFDHASLACGTHTCTTGETPDNTRARDDPLCSVSCLPSLLFPCFLVSFLLLLLLLFSTQGTLTNLVHLMIVCSVHSHERALYFKSNFVHKKSLKIKMRVVREVHSSFNFPFPPSHIHLIHFTHQRFISSTPVLNPHGTCFTHRPA